MLRLRSLLSRLTEDYLLLALLLLLPLLLGFKATTASGLAALVDWHTVTALAGLMLLSRALEDSGYLARFAAWLLPRCHSERLLALLLLLFAALLSAIVTNDVALFDGLTALDLHAAKVCINCALTRVVLDHHHVAVSTLVAALGDCAIAHGYDGCTGGGCIVNAGVGAPSLQNRMEA